MPKMKKWPKGHETVQAEDLVKPVLKVLREGYKLIRKPLTSIPYDGYNIGADELAGCLSPRETFSKRGLQYHEERDRSLLEIALYVVFQLGIEQGRRIASKELVKERDHYKLMAKIYQKQALKGSRTCPQSKG